MFNELRRYLTVVVKLFNKEGFVITAYITDRIKIGGGMEGKIMFWFDKEGDVLEISIGKPIKALSKEVGEDIIVRINPKNKEIVGFTILNFTKRFENLKKTEKIDLPLKAKITSAN